MRREAKAYNGVPITAIVRKTNILKSECFF